MVRLLKQLILVSVLMLGVEKAGAFALIGPLNEAYQVPVIAYGIGGDIGAPKNLGEEYRWNRPVVYYSANQTFLDYFGSNGLYAVDAACSVMNGLTNVSRYTGALSEMPLEMTRENYLAQALGLYDLRSATLNLLVEQLGLAEPERYVWSLHNRFTLPGGSCPANQVYDVIKRNFDPVFSNPDQLQPSSYVNGTLYSYLILEACTGPNPLADAIEFAVDPTALTFTAVASLLPGYGSFFTGLTRDDVAGLRYLMRTNNYNFENNGSETITFVTNNTIQLLFTSNLTALASASLTNDAATMAALFPGLQVASTVTIFTNVVTTNTIFYFTNSPFAPSSAPAQLVSATVVTTNIATHFRHTFENVVTNTFFTNGLVTVVTTNISTTACSPFAPAGLICQSITSVSFMTNGVFGDYFLIPSNNCGVSIVSTQLILNVGFTNPPVFAAVTGATNLGIEVFSKTTIGSFNQYIFQIKPVVCPANTLGLRQGIERVQFVRRDLDSLLGRFFFPVTNDYPITVLTNNSLVTRIVRRVVTTPDILMDADDLAPGPNGVLLAVPPAARSISYDQGNINPGLAGPGVFNPGQVFTYNKVGPIYQNQALDLLDQAGALLWFIWGSFDGTTNAPVVYPNGTDILNIENQALIQITPAGPALPSISAAGTVNYSTVFSGFTVSGGATPPYNWSLAAGSPGLPPGLLLNTSTGAITGDPTTQGIYDFTLHMTDSVGRFVVRDYSITVLP